MSNPDVTGGSATDQTALLLELVRQSERVIEAQLHASEEGDDKSEQILAVALLVMAGGAAAAQLVVSNDSTPDAPFLVLLMGGLTCAAVAFWHVGRGYVGVGEDAVWFWTGWDTKELARIAETGGYTRDEILRAHTKAADAWAGHNLAWLSRLASQRIAGAWFLFGAGFLLGLAFLYALIRLS